MYASLGDQSDSIYTLGFQSSSANTIISAAVSVIPELQAFNDSTATWQLLFF